MKLDELLTDQLDEVLDKPLPYRIMQSSEHSFQAEFVAGDREIIFTASNTFEAWEDDDVDNDREWNIEFEEKKGHSPATQELTGSGEEFKVFATVKAIIFKFIKIHKPFTIRLIASKQDKNRVRLYRRMFKTHMPEGWKVKEFEDAGAVVFLLSS